MLNFNKAKTIISKPKFTTGFTLVEVLVGSAVFVILAVSVYQAYSLTMNVVRLSRVKITATALANEQFEILRNLSYENVGVIGSLPPGKIPYIQNLIRDGKEFTVKTTIRNIDDPFDGTIDGYPRDTSPADYKLAELEINCNNCKNFQPFFVNTYIAPENLESSSNNGALFVKVFDSAGVPIQGVDIYIENKQTIPNFVINDTTNNDGLLQIVDAPPGNQAYIIRVSKPGYTSERTYTIGDPENPTPEKSDVTVLTQQLTQTSFIIDLVNTLNIKSIGTNCEAIPNINFHLKGTKIIGTSPIIYKYNATNTTDGTGNFTINSLDTDTYSLTYPEQDHIIAGIIPDNTFSLSASTTRDLKLILAPVASSSLFIKVKDISTGLALSGASIRLSNTNYSNTINTSEETECQASGQAFFTGLNPGNYTLEVSKTGYQTHTIQIPISLTWQEKEVELMTIIN